MRPIALGRKNYLFMGSAAGGKAAAIAYTLIETASSTISIRKPGSPRSSIESPVLVRSCRGGGGSQRLRARFQSFRSGRSQMSFLGLSYSLSRS